MEKTQKEYLVGSGKTSRKLAETTFGERGGNIAKTTWIATRHDIPREGGVLQGKEGNGAKKKERRGTPDLDKEELRKKNKRGGEPRVQDDFICQKQTFRFRRTERKSSKRPRGRITLCGKDLFGGVAAQLNYH